MARGNNAHPDVLAELLTGCGLTLAAAVDLRLSAEHAASYLDELERHGFAYRATDIETGGDVWIAT